MVSTIHTAQHVTEVEHTSDRKGQAMVPLDERKVAPRVGDLRKLDALAILDHHWTSRNSRSERSSNTLPQVQTKVRSDPWASFFPQQHNHARKRAGFPTTNA